MLHKFSAIRILWCLFLLTGCSVLGVNQLSPTNTQVSQVQEISATPQPRVIVITATPEAVTQYIVVTATPQPTTEQAAATSTPMAAIKMANTNLQANNLIYVSWNADGAMPGGFEVLWSTTNTAPTFPADSSTYISDPNARATYVQAQPGHTYYFRVCRYVNGGCDLYSDVAAVNSGTAYVPPVQPTVFVPVHTQPEPVWLNQPSDMALHPTSTAASPFINIYSIRSSGSGAAVIHWSALGSFPNGFLVLYANVPSTPTYGDYAFYSVGSGSARYTTVSGTPGTTYYFRVCRYTGTSCDLYSNVYSFTF